MTVLQQLIAAAQALQDIITKTAQAQTAISNFLAYLNSTP